jgi:hypothetical protein
MTRQYRPLSLFSLAEEPEKLKAELPELFAQWEAATAEAEPIFQMEGESLVKLSAQLPHHQFRYAALAQEARQVVKWLEVYKGRAESRYTKNYAQQPRALGVREQATMLQGEAEVVVWSQLIVEAALHAGRLGEVKDALQQMAYSLKNVVTLRVAEMHEALV